MNCPRHARLLGLGLLLCAAVCVSVAQSASYTVVPVDDGGVITGRVTWSGPEPQGLEMTINKDAEVCDPDGKKVRDLERLVISHPGGGLANTVVFLNDITKGKAMIMPEARRSLDQRHCRYEPHILVVPQNGTLEMKSSDPVLHTIHMDGSASFNLPFPFANRPISRDMTTTGLVNLRCNGGHVWMNAEMMVVPHPYYAVTDVDGNFTLTDVPPGQYEIM